MSDTAFQREMMSGGAMQSFPAFIKRAVFGCIALFVPIALLTAGTEYLLRLQGLGNPLLYEYRLGYGYQLQPNQKAVRLRGATVAINGDGLRSASEWRPGAMSRVLFIGDSITYGGSYVDDRELFSELVCRGIEDSSCGNAGANAYGTDNMARRLLIELDRLRPTVVVVTLYYGDTVRGQSTLKAMPVFSKPPAAPIPAIIEAGAFVLDEVRARIRFLPSSAADTTFDQESLSEAKRSLSELFSALATARDRGAQVLVVYSPTINEFRNGRSGLGAFVFDQLARSGFPTLDMLAVMQSNGQAAMYYDDVHFEPAGHRLFAEAILRSLAEKERPR